MTAPLPVTALVKRRATLVQASAPNRLEWLFRLVILVLLAASVALAYWSLKVRLLPLQKQSRQLTLSVTRLADQVDELERKWPKADAEQVVRKYEQATGQLFTDQVALEAWLTSLKLQANPLSLETKTSFGKTISQMSGQQELAVIPATVAVDVRPALNLESKESPYQRVLRLARQLTGPGRRADLAELNVTGGVDSVKSAALVFHLWAGQEEKP